MKQILPLAIFGLIAASIQAQKIDESKVPAPVKTAFHKGYPTITTVNWEREKANYEANFKEGTSEETAVYDGLGKFVQLEREIDLVKLPGPVADYFAKNLGGKKIKEAVEIKSAAGVVTYEAEVNEVDYTFDASGKYLSQEADED